MNVSLQWVSLFSGSILLCASAVSAGIEVDADAGVQAVMEAQEEVKPTTYEPSKLAIDLVDESAARKNYVTDPAKPVYFAKGSASRNVSPTNPNFLNIRELIATEAILRAKTDLIISRMATASASEFIALAGPSIQAQLDQASSQQKAAQEQLDRQLVSLKAEAGALAEGLDAALAAEAKGITWDDRGKRLLDAIIKKLDETYDSESILEDKKQQVDRLKKRRDNVNSRASEVLLASQELERQIQAIRGDVGTKVSTSIAVESQMPLFGATVMFQAESYDDLYENLQVAVLVAWSPKLEREAQHILLGSGKIVPRESKLSLDDWLGNQDLANMVGPRRYLARDGSDNYIGIAAAEYNKQNLSTMTRAETSATLSAQRMALLSLQAEVAVKKGKEQAGIDSQSLREGSVRTEQLYYEALSESMSQEVKDLNIAGLEKRKVIRTLHPATGKNMVVVVANINSAIAAQSPALMRDTYALLKELNTDQSYRKGQKAGMQEEAAKSKDDTVAYRQGRAAGASGVAAKDNSNQQETKQLPRAQGGESTGQGGTTKPGAWMGDSDVD
ncbi:hypothetical protein N8Z40_10830, partial [Pseudomonadales bacterium]|nr:hypothetical protein [Pseudomonadales bacterium]